MWLMSRDNFHLNARTQCFPDKSVMCGSPVSGFNVGANQYIMIMLFFFFMDLRLKIAQRNNKGFVAVINSDTADLEHEHLTVFTF